MLIIEGIVTSLDDTGAINFAPMGVEWGEERIILKPFVETTTFRNVRARGAAVFNLVDDVMFVAQAAISSPQFPWRPAEQVKGAVLTAACSWRELEVESLDETPPRSRIVCRVVHRGLAREFIGFNRARHAVLEAAILATRVHLIPADELDAQLARLEIPLRKTAGERELEAWELVTGHIAAQRASL